MTKRSRKVDAIYAIIRHAAANGLDAPKNVALAAAIGAASTGGIPAYIRQMSADGRLTVEHGECHKVRRFYVTEVGRWTGWNLQVAAGTRDGSDPSGAGSPAPAVPAAVPVPAAPVTRQSAQMGAGEPPFGRTVPRVVATIHFSTCQYLAGEPRDRDFCGAPVKPGSPYCPAHHKRCYRPVDGLPDANVPAGSGEAGVSGLVMDAAE